MNKRFSTIYKLFLAIFLLYFLSYFFAVNEKEFGGGAEIPENLKLKVAKEKILYSEEIEKGSDDKEKITQYLYTTDKEVKKQVEQIDGFVLEEDLSKRTNNAFFFEKRESGDVKTNEEKWHIVVYSGYAFHKENDKWFRTEVATTTTGAFLEQNKPTVKDKVLRLFGKGAFAACGDSGGDCYPLAGNGTLGYYGNTFANLRNGVGTAYNLTNNAFLGTYRGSGGEYYIFRAVMPFDIPAFTGTVTSAKLYLYATTRYNQNSKTLSVIQTTQQTTSSLASSDYGELTLNSPDIGSTVNIADISTSAYNEFELNATGRGWIVNGGVTKLGLRNSPDIDNSFPAINNSNGDAIIIKGSAETGTDKDPKLIITYTASTPTEERRKANQPQMIIF
jgi:hypothetical protein